jgi:hypothetical protein
VDHGVGIVFKFHRNFCVFHKFCRYVDWAERGLFLQGEYIDRVSRDNALACNTGDGRGGRCLISCGLDSCGHGSPLACMWSRWGSKLMRWIERDSS